MGSKTWSLPVFMGICFLSTAAGAAAPSTPMVPDAPTRVKSPGTGKAGRSASKKGPKAASAAKATSSSTKAGTDAPKTESAVAPATPAAAAAPAAGALSVPCSSATSKEPRCGRPSWINGNVLGGGPPIRGTAGYPSIGEGFVDGQRLVVAVEMGQQKDDQGAIFAVDLKTGERKVLSGKIEDPATGPVVVGTGPDLGNVRAVTQAGASWMALVSTGAQQPTSIVRIDPRTGNRTLERKVEGFLPSCTGSTARLQIDPTSGIAAAADGTVYVAVGNISAANGIVALKGSSCSVVTMTGAGGFETRGTGPTVESTDHFRGLKLEGGKLWALHGMTNSLFTIDVASGNRARVSSGLPATRVGAGDAKLGYKFLSLAGSKVWTAGGWGGNNGFVLTEATAATGARVERKGLEGPASHPDDVTGVWAHPTQPLVVFAVDNAFALYDPATGQSALFSE